MAFSPAVSRSFFLCLCLGALFLSACSSTGDMSAQRPETSADTSVKIDHAIEKALSKAEKEGNKQDSLALLENIYRRNDTNPEVAVRYARALREDEQMNRARLILTPHSGKNDPYQPALTEMAMIHLGLGQYKEAEKHARNAVLLNEKDGRAYLALGTALDAQGLHNEAEDAFRKGLDMWKGDPAPILNNLALNLAAQGQTSEALNVLEKAREISPRRLEIERNYRIISTLNETAVPRAPKPPRKPASLEKKQAKFKGLTTTQDNPKAATMTPPEKREPITLVEPAGGPKKEKADPETVKTEEGTKRAAPGPTGSIND